MSASSTPERNDGSRLMIRLFWMILGNAIAGILAALIWDATGTEELVLSGIYWATIGLVVAARYVDIRRFDGLTADGQPATLKHWRRHTIGLLTLGAAVWGVTFFA